ELDRQSEDMVGKFDRLLRSSTDVVIYWPTKAEDEHNLYRDGPPSQGWRRGTSSPSVVPSSRERCHKRARGVQGARTGRTKPVPHEPRCAWYQADSVADDRGPARAHRPPGRGARLKATCLRVRRRRRPFTATRWISRNPPTDPWLGHRLWSDAPHAYTTPGRAPGH